jgi:glycosyltransferase involved in cell wall biosynthesis
VPPEDPVALAAAICQLLGDRDAAQQMGDNGRRLMLAEFRIDQTVSGIEAVYRGMLDTTPMTNRSEARPA